MKHLIYTGRIAALSSKLKSEVKRLLEERIDTDVFVVVPNQLTLETEITLMDALGMKGSVRLNVVSPGRFCGRIFEEAGRKNAVSVDERGKAMLMGYLLRKHSSKLGYYKKSYAKAGFESKLVEAVTHFKQAGITPEALEKCIEIEEDSALGKKLTDIMFLYGKYEELLAGHMTDGEDEVSEALDRMRGASMLKNAYVLFYGFDITTNYINRLAAGTALNCLGVSVFLPLPGDGEMRDISIYIPMQDAYLRLKSVFDEFGVPFSCVHLKEPQTTRNAVQRATKELYCVPTEQVTEETDDICIAKLKNPLEEAFYVAGRIRSLVRENGWHYSDIRVLLEDDGSHEDIIRTAFDSMQIPYFTQDMRDALKHPLCMFLTETFNLILGKPLSASAIMETGFTTLTDAESEALMSYIRAARLRPSAMMRHFTRGKSETLARAEEIRQKLITPVLALKTAVKEAKTLKEQLNAVYNYLTEMKCFEKSAYYREKMLEKGLVSCAADDIRVGNMILGIFDQMLELFGEKPMSATMLFDLIGRAMGSVIIKTLPQSPDAVQVASPQRSGLTPVKAVFMMNALAESVKTGGEALSDNDIGAVTQVTGKYIRPDEVALARTNRMYVKNAFMLAEEFLCVTYPAGGIDGGAKACGAIVNELKHVASKLSEHSDVNDDEHILKMLLCAPDAARRYIAAHFEEIEKNNSTITALKAVCEEDDLPAVTKARGYRLQSEKLVKPLPKKLYKERTSVTTLEQFAKCPFKHFVGYGLRPQEEETYDINERVKGIFYHKCVQDFAAKAKNHIPETEEEAAELMKRISKTVISESLSELIGDDPILLGQTETLERIIARAARIIQRQMKSGVFRPYAEEQKYRDNAVELDDGTVIRVTSKPDRIDMGSVNGTDHVLVVDYKSGNNDLDPVQIYEGLQLQLLMYLSAASNELHADDAGAYYFHIADKIVKIDSIDEADIEKERRKTEKMHGLAPNDKDLLRAIAENPSDILNITLVKDGSPRKGCATATAEQFADVKAHIVEKAKEFTRSVFEGVTEIDPVSGKVDGCRYCSYAAICMKDRKIKRAAPKRKVKHMKYEELYERISGKGENREDT